MSVQVEQDVIHLIGHCAVEDAETLLLAIQDGPSRAINLSAATRLHMAVAQIIAAARPTVAVMPQDPFLRDLLLPALLGKISR